MRFMLITACALGAATGAAPAQEDAGGPPDLPVVYTMTTPFEYYGEDVVTVRQNAEHLSVAHRHGGDSPSPLQPGSDADLNLTVDDFLFAGPRTDGRAARYDAILLAIQDLDAFEEGTRYVADERYDPDEHAGEESWSASGLEAGLHRGEDDRDVAGYGADHYTLDVGYTLTRYDGQGEIASEDAVSHSQDMWFLPELPYSPVQLLAGRVGGRALSGSGRAMLDQAVQARIEPLMREIGAVARIEMAYDENMYGPEAGPVVIEMRDLAAADAEYAPESITSLPVVAEAEAEAVIGTLFIAEMLQGGEGVPEEGDASLAFDGPAELSFDGRAGWKETGTGDFALALSSGAAEGERGLVVIMRPANGVPEPGAYGVAGRMGRDELEALDPDALNARAGRFQAFGLLEHEGVLYALTGFSGGEVEIESAGEDRVTGSLQGVLDAVDTRTGETGISIEVEAEFDAVPGLDRFYFRSPISRMMD